MFLPFAAELVWGLADLFLLLLSATGSSSTSFSARELRLLGPLGFSTAALRETDIKTTTNRKKKDKVQVCYKQARVLHYCSSQSKLIPIRTVLFSSSTTDAVRLHPDSIHYVDIVTACVFEALTHSNTYLGTKLMGVFLFFAHLW